MGIGPEQIFFQGRHTDGQQTHENMLNITNYQGYENQNQSEISPHTFQNGYYPKNNKQQLFETSWRKGNPCTYLWACILVQPLWKTVWRFLKKLKIELPYNPAFPLLCILHEDNENTKSKRYMYTWVHCSTIYKSQNIEATCVHQ